MFISTPVYLAAIVKSELLPSADLSSLASWACGGGMVSPTLIQGMNKYLPKGKVCVGYGLTEVGTVTVNFSDNHESVGTLKLGVKVKIVDDDGRRLGEGENGEVLVWRKKPFLGYFEDEQATSDAFDDEGYFRTGDVGHFDEDGFLYLVDRKKEFIKYNGLQLAPAELEGILIEHPAIANVCVVGIPDEECVDLPAAVVVKKADYQLTEETVKQLISGKSRAGGSIQKNLFEKILVFVDRLADFKQLRGGVYFVDEMPMTPSGKVARRSVKKLAVQLRGQSS